MNSNIAIVTKRDRNPMDIIRSISATSPECYNLVDAGEGFVNYLSKKYEKENEERECPLSFAEFTSDVLKNRRYNTNTLIDSSGNVMFKVPNEKAILQTDWVHYPVFPYCFGDPKYIPVYHSSVFYDKFDDEVFVENCSTRDAADYLSRIIDRIVASVVHSRRFRMLIDARSETADILLFNDIRDRDAFNVFQCEVLKKITAISEEDSSDEDIVYFAAAQFCN